MDPFRVEFPADFVWQVPSELQSKVEVLRRKSSSADGLSLAECLEGAMNASNQIIGLSQLITPGDRVAFAVDPHTPSLLSLLSLLIAELERLQASLEESVVILPAHCDKLAAEIRTHLAAQESLPEFKVLVHDAGDRSAIAYLAANVAGDPIYTALALADADVVIPIFSTDGDASSKPGATARFLRRGFGAIPEEAPEKGETKKRRTDRTADEQQTDQDAEEAFWQLGVLCGIVVAPGLGGEAGQIVIGPPPRLDQAIADARREWFCSTDESANLVIAEVSGGVDQQNWGSAARALRLAAQVASPEGMIVLLTDLPEGGISRKAMRAAIKAISANAGIGADQGISDFAVVTKEVRNANPIFLRSKLTEEATEDLGFGFVSKPSELTRLVDRQPRCILIRDAQHLQIESQDAVSTPPSSQRSHVQ